jgi:hypothetical protein
MKLTIEPTSELVFVNGAAARIWQGTTDKGTPIYAIVAMVAVPAGSAPDIHAQFERELVEQHPRFG